MQGIGFIVYILVGLFQIAAVLSGLEDWLGLHWIIAIVIAVPVAYIPLVGTVLGMAGAITVWHWPWWLAGLLFFGGLVFTVLVGGLSVVADKFSRK